MFIRIFGAALFLSLFDLRVIRQNLFIVKSTKGKGVFCLLYEKIYFHHYLYSIATTFLMDPTKAS